MRMRPIGPESPGLGRVFAVRVMLLLTMAFFVAGGAMAGLIAMGAHPLTYR